MASTSSSTANDTSQSSTAADNTSQTSTTDEETTITDEKARTVISKVATKIPIPSAEQLGIIHTELEGVLTLQSIKDCFARYENASRIRSYTAAEFRALVQKHLDEDG